MDHHALSSLVTVRKTRRRNCAHIQVEVVGAMGGGDPRLFTVISDPQCHQAVTSTHQDTGLRGLCSQQATTVESTTGALLRASASMPQEADKRVPHCRDADSLPRSRFEMPSSPLTDEIMTSDRMGFTRDAGVAAASMRASTLGVSNGTTRSAPRLSSSCSRDVAPRMHVETCE